MIIAFTGTSRGRGMTQEQHNTVLKLFKAMPLDTLHHGCCINADAQAHALAIMLGSRVEGYPPTDKKKLARLAGFTVLHPPQPYLKRNRRIVERGTDGLVACPRSMVEPASLRGEGTWTTVGYARQAGRHIWIVLPDGRVREEQ